MEMARNSDYQMRFVIRFLFSLFNILGGSDGKEYACNAGDLDSTPGLRRSPGEWNDYSSILAWRIPWTE